MAAGPRRPAARRIAIDLSIMTVIGVILALVGPFGSFEEPLHVRLVVWLAFAYIGYAIYAPMGFLVDRAEAALELPRSALWFVAVIIATFPMTFMVLVVGYLPGPITLPEFEMFAGTYPYVFVIGGGVTALFFTLKSGEREAVSTPYPVPAGPSAATGKGQPERGPAPSNPSLNPLFDQLPASLGTDVIALEMEDHYVRVHTALGSELVLMRLRDAIAHLSEIEGRQVHRSWWVARLAVEDVRREGRNVRLILPGGLEAPVARAQVSELREAGWF
jgi:hypothetical protein